MFRVILSKIANNKNLKGEEEDIIFLLLHENSAAWHRRRLRKAMERGIALLQVDTPEREWEVVCDNHRFLTKEVDIDIDLPMEEKIFYLKYERP